MRTPLLRLVSQLNNKRSHILITCNSLPLERIPLPYYSNSEKEEFFNFLKNRNNLYVTRMKSFGTVYQLIDHYIESNKSVSGCNLPLGRSNFCFAGNLNLDDIAEKRYLQSDFLDFDYSEGMIDHHSKFEDTLFLVDSKDINSILRCLHKENFKFEIPDRPGYCLGID